MKLRRNEFCPINRSFFCCGREPIRSRREAESGALASSGSKTRTTPGDTANSGRKQKYESCFTTKLSNSNSNVPSVRCVHQLQRHRARPH